MKLLIKIAGEKEREVHLKVGTHILGRGKESDIPVFHTGVSRRHVQFDVTEEKVFIQDLGSSNGSKLGTSELTPNLKVEFTSFFPLILAKEIEISLIAPEAMHDMMSSRVDDIVVNSTPQTSELKTRTIRRRNMESVNEVKSSKAGPLIKVLVLLILVVALLYFLKPDLLGL